MVAVGNDDRNGGVANKWRIYMMKWRNKISNIGAKCGGRIL